MKNNVALVLVLLVCAAVGFGAYKFASKHADTPVMSTGAVTPKDATYRIDGQSVTLVNGVAQVEAAPGSASKTTTTYFGNEAQGDLNADGIPDTAFLLTQSSGGSGTFYYAVAAVRAADGTYTGTDAVLLGDRIAPQTTEIKDGLLTVNFADRNAGEDFSVRPSAGKSMVLKLDPGTMQFGEVAQNFEGEADPSAMSLTMNPWSWIQTTYASTSPVTPKNPKFVLTFTADNKFSATTDCNGVSGEYTVKGNKIVLSKMVSTLMFCDGSQEADFTGMLTSAQTYSFTSKGELILGLSKNGGSMTFK